MDHVICFLLAGFRDPGGSESTASLYSLFESSVGTREERLYGRRRGGLMRNDPVGQHADLKMARPKVEEECCLNKSVYICLEAVVSLMCFVI